jgi:bacteriocin biosynthesis cyclodehydratase domain-containing protein
MDKSLLTYALAPYCEVLELNGILHVGFGSVGVKFSSDFDKEFIYLLLGSVRPDRSIDQSFLDNATSEPERSILQKLISNHLIVPRGLVPPYSRNHRDHLYYLMSGSDPSAVAATLRDRSVCIIGCGGIGCIVAITLATAGVGKIILIDDDVVEIHNISRQFAYTELDLGKKKVNVLEDELRKRNSSVSVEILDCRARFAAAASNVPRCDFVVLSADERGLMFPANEYFVRIGQPFLHICYVNDIAVWGPFVVPGKTGCWHCHRSIGSDIIDGQPDRTAALQAINATYICPVISPLSLIATSFACLDIIKFLSRTGDPISLNRRVGVWTNNLTIEYQDFSRNQECAVCKSVTRSAVPNIVRLPWWPWRMGQSSVRCRWCGAI